MTACHVTPTCTPPPTPILSTQAYLEAKTLLSMVYGAFSFELAPGATVVYENNVILAMRYGLPLIPRRRR